MGRRSRPRSRGACPGRNPALKHRLQRNPPRVRRAKEIDAGHGFFHRGLLCPSRRSSVHDAGVDVWGAVLAQAHPHTRDVAATVDHAPAARAILAIGPCSCWCWERWPVIDPVPASSSRTIGKKPPRQWPVSEYMRRRPTGVRTRAFSNPAADDLAALVGIRCRPYVRDSISRTGIADSSPTVACLDPQAAAHQAVAGCARRTATKLIAATKHNTPASMKAGSYVPNMSRLTPVPKAITPAATW